MSEEFNEEQEMIINHEYKMWKKQAPHTYDFLLLHSLDIPSYSFEWLPHFEIQQDFTNHYALLASNSPQTDKCSLIKIKVEVPHQGKGEAFMNRKGNKVQIVQKILHNGEINRARYCPGNSNLFAVSSANGEIDLMTMKESVGKLVSHTSEGYGLAWNPINHNILLSGQTDKKICIWDIEKNKLENLKYSPVTEIIYHNAPVEDVAWHRFHQNIFASCSDDRLLMIWDQRDKSNGSKGEKKPLFEIVAHTNEIYSLDFSPFNEFLLLSGSADETASVWDMRNLTRSLSTIRSPTMNGERGSIIKAQWSPFTSTIFATCGYGRKVDVWDLSKENPQGQNQEINYLFRHGGHRSKVMDMDWNKNEKLLMGSVQESNCLHVWQMAKSIYYEEE